MSRVGRGQRDTNFGLVFHIRFFSALFFFAVCCLFEWLAMQALCGLKRLLFPKHCSETNRNRLEIKKSEVFKL